MATTTPSIPPQAAALPKKRGTALKATLAVVLILGANVAFWYFRDKPWMLHAMHAQGAPAIEPIPQRQTEEVALEPFTVNLNASEGYLKVAVTLEVLKPAATGKEVSDEPATLAHSAAVRDTILTVLMSQSPASLLSGDGGAQLKKDMTAALSERFRDLELKQIFFTEFIIQR